MRIAHIDQYGTHSYILFDRQVFVRIDWGDGDKPTALAGETPRQWFDFDFWKELGWKVVHDE